MVDSRKFHSIIRHKFIASRPRRRIHVPQRVRVVERFLRYRAHVLNERYLSIIAFPLLETLTQDVPRHFRPPRVVSQVLRDEDGPLAPSSLRHTKKLRREGDGDFVRQRVHALAL